MLSTKYNKLYVLVDCNNFYASCEMIFRPDLLDKPVVVLSNNDGCIVSRSKKAKEIGIPMGLPLYKQKDLLLKHNVHVFSSNYPLYGDISQRIMSILEEICPEVEQYSIDEAFLTFSSASALNILEIAQDIRKKILQWVGVTVSLGIATTRTLAKIANYRAKKSESGIEFFSSDIDLDEILKQISVEEVWGIGRKSALKCRTRELYTAYDLKKAEDVWVKKTLSISGLQTVLELRGISCYTLDDLPSMRKSILYSRSFGQKITKKKDLEEALSSFAANAAVKLRKVNLYALRMVITISTSKERRDTYSRKSIENVFTFPTDITQDFLRIIPCLLSEIYEENKQYVKAGILLYDLHNSSNLQGSLLQDNEGSAQEKNQHKLNIVLDTINYRYGRHTIAYGAEGQKQVFWKGKQEHCSPQFTTKWEEVKRVLA